MDEATRLGLEAGGDQTWSSASVVVAESAPLVSTGEVMGASNVLSAYLGFKDAHAHGLHVAANFMHTILSENKNYRALTCHKFCFNF